MDFLSKVYQKFLLKFWKSIIFKQLGFLMRKTWRKSHGLENHGKRFSSHLVMMLQERGQYLKLTTFGKFEFRLSECFLETYIHIHVDSSQKYQMIREKNCTTVTSNYSVLYVIEAKCCKQCASALLTYV